MPAKSKSQQRLFGAVHACQKSGDCASPEIKKIAKSISKTDAKDFAQTKHKGLPEKKKKKKKVEECVLPNFREWMEIKGLSVDEGMWDTAKNIGKAAVIGGAMMSPFAGGNAAAPTAPTTPTQPTAQAQDPMAIKQAFDNHSTSNSTMTPQQWKMMASKYPGKNAGGFIPDPSQAGRWIPANGADSVRLQSTTQVNNDQVTKDNIGTTPYKGGQPMGATNWSQYGQQ